MGTLKFSLKMLRLDFKKCLFYGISLVLSTSIIFVFFNYITIGIMLLQGFFTALSLLSL